MLQYVRPYVRPLGLAVSLLVGACSTGGRPPADGAISRSEREAMEEIRRAIVLEALGQIGRPYRHGGTTPDGFDCSGLVQYVYLQAGVKVPRSSREQHQAGKPIPLSAAQPGDLLFYRFSSSKVDHVAVYLGEGKAVHAPANGRKVIVAGVSEPAWTKRFVDAVRILH